MKKFLSLVLTLVLLCGLCESSALAADKPEKVAILWRLYGQQGADCELVVEELNKVLRELRALKKSLYSFSS